MKKEEKDLRIVEGTTVLVSKKNKNLSILVRIFEENTGQIMGLNTKFGTTVLVSYNDIDQYFDVVNPEPTEPEKKFPLIEDEDFSLGDTVVVTDNGEVYTIYRDLFEELDFVDKKGNTCSDNEWGTVSHICENNFTSETILVLDIINTDRQVAISKEGVHKMISVDE